MTKVLNVSFAVSHFSSLLKRPFHILCGDRNDRSIKLIIQFDSKSIVERYFGIKVYRQKGSSCMLLYSDCYRHFRICFLALLSLTSFSSIYIYKTIVPWLPLREHCSKLYDDGRMNSVRGEEHQKPRNTSTDCILIDLPSSMGPQLQYSQGETPGQSGQCRPI